MADNETVFTYRRESRHIGEEADDSIQQIGTIQDKGVKLPFGTKLGKVSPGQYLNPRLYNLLHYVYRHGPCVTEGEFSTATAIELTDKKEIKSLLSSGKALCISDYSVRTILFVVRSFVKHLPRPLLSAVHYRQWIATGNIVHHQCHLPAKQEIVTHNIHLLMDDIPFHEIHLLKHLLVSLHSLSCSPDNRMPNLDRVHELALLFGPCLIRRRCEWVKGKNNYKKNMVAKEALMAFLIIQVYHVFGNGLKKLYPMTEGLCQNDCCNMNFSGSVASDIGSHRMVDDVQELMKQCVPFGQYTPDIGEVAGKVMVF